MTTGAGETTAAGRRVLLEARGLRAAFGGLLALDAVDLQVFAGEIVALIGPNGAGKTTLFNCLTGLCAPTGGDVRVFPASAGEHRIVDSAPGRRAARGTIGVAGLIGIGLVGLIRFGFGPIGVGLIGVGLIRLLWLLLDTPDGARPDRVTAAGIARTFQNIRLFPEMSALENVMVGRHVRTTAGVLGALLRGPGTRAEEREIAAAARELLERVGLGAVAGEPAASLPYGLQRRLEIARALATRPLVLLLDEPAAGLNPRETAGLDELIRRIRDDLGVTILLIEHDMRLVMGLAERIVVLEHGRLIANGTPAQVRADPAVIRAYLGAQP